MPRGRPGKKRAAPGSDESDSFSESGSDASGNGSDPEADYGKAGSKGQVAKRASGRPVRQASLNARTVAAKLAKAEENSEEDGDEEDPDEEAPAAPAAKATTPAVNDEDVAKNVGMNNFLRGQEYLNGRLKDFQHDVATHTISAKCKGTAAEEYAISVKFQQPASVNSWTASCSCPVGGEGKCKHVACLLLHWQEVATGVKKDRNRRSAAEAAKIDAKISEISNLSVQKLKDMLKANDQSTTGSKPELLERVADGMLNGSLPRCTKCGGGRLRFKQGCYFCPGYMEDDTFRECDFFSENVARNPWKNAE